MISTTSGLFAVPSASNGFGRYTERPQGCDTSASACGHRSIPDFRALLWNIIEMSNSKDEALFDLKRVSAIPTAFYRQREAAIKWTHVHWEQTFGGSL